jgi:phosphatidylglycerophosphate synthase
VAAASLLWLPAPAAVTAVFILASWFLDRCDGMLARRQGTASPLGAWLDANVDELVDVGLHAAVAWAAASATGTALPWALLIGFLAGKYLFVYGLAEERQLLAAQPKPEATAAASPTHAASEVAPRWAWLRRLYHLPGNADVRVHLLVGAVLCGWLTAELAVVAAYYNARWIARYVLVARRLRSEAP